MFRNDRETANALFLRRHEGPGPLNLVVPLPEDLIPIESRQGTRTAKPHPPPFRGVSDPFEDAKHLLPSRDEFERRNFKRTYLGHEGWPVCSLNSFFL